MVVRYGSGTGEMGDERSERDIVQCCACAMRWPSRCSPLARISAWRSDASEKVETDETGREYLHKDALEALFSCARLTLSDEEYRNLAETAAKITDAEALRKELLDESKRAQNESRNFVLVSLAEAEAPALYAEAPEARHQEVSDYPSLSYWPLRLVCMAGHQNPHTSHVQLSSLAGRS